MKIKNITEINITGIAILLFIVMVGFVPLCHADTKEDSVSAEDVRQETREVLDVLKDYTADQRDEAIKKINNALANLDDHIDALEKRIDNNWDKMDNAAREKARASMRELRKQRTQLAEWYGGLKNSSADAWEQMTQGFSEAYQSLQDSWDKAVREFGSDK